MSQPFKILTKQPKLAQLMQQVVQNGRLGHAYLFEGTPGAGQMDMAIYLAAAVFCQDEDKPCGQCDNCRRVVNGDYGDLVLVQPEEDSFKVDQVRELRQNLSLTAMEGRGKVFILDQADKMTASAANSLLKFLEEPNPGIYLFLLTTNREAILTTIQSRCQIIHFPPLDKAQVEEALVQVGIDPNQAHFLSFLTADLAQAQAWSEDDIFQKQCQKAWPWAKLILDGKTKAFTYVATEWIKLTRERAENRRLLDILTLYFQDLLLVMGEGDNLDPQALSQPKQVQDYQTYAQRVPLPALLDMIQDIARAQAMIAHNVGVQAALEYFVLAARDHLNQNR